MKRSKFSLSHYKLATMDMGKLIPLSWFEAIPGDSIQMSTSALIRCAPLLAPVMHPALVRIHHWFVPNRLIWDNFEDFITGGEDGNDETEHPYVAISSVTQGSLHDHMGLPVTAGFSPDINVSALPFRAYNLIFNEHYRDQDLVPELTIDLADGADSTTETEIQNVAWGKDYFTTARPWEQKGDQVTIPIGISAPITGIGALATTNWVTGPTNAYETDGAGATSYAKYKNPSQVNQHMLVEEDPDNAGYPNIRANLAEATGIPISDLRLALAIQRYQEARAQYGSRYVEYLRSLGVRGSDARLASPEFLGGGKNTIQFSEVLATDGTNTGAMYGHGIAALRSNRYRRFFEEHGIVMTLMSVIPRSIYTQGISKKWSREVKEDYFQKELQFIGEDEVTNKEVYADHTTPEGIFGYQARYDEYRNGNSSVSGEFLSTLDHWHMARIFTSDPGLNQSFTDCVPTKRIFAAPGSDCLYVMASHSIQARRMVAKRAYNKTL